MRFTAAFSIAGLLLVGGPQTDQTPTVLGAILDSAPVDVRVGSIAIRVYDAARNEVYRNQGALGWRRMTYFYESPLSVARDASGRPDIRVFETLDGTGDVVQLRIAALTVDPESVAGAIRQSQRNPYAERSRVSPLTVFRIEVSVPGVPSAVIDAVNGVPIDTGWLVQFKAPAGRGKGLADQLTNGLALRVRLQTLTKLTELTEMRVTATDVMKTRVYQRYFGPAGPQFVTGDQALRITREISSELGVFQWHEGNAAAGGLVNRLLDLLFQTRVKTQLSLEEAGDPAKLLVDLAGMTGQRDLIRRIATDAKQLHADEWCRKYGRDSTRNSSSSTAIGGGFDIVGIFGADGNYSSSDSSGSTDKQMSEDCGKRHVENNFKYEFEGEKYVPKSIYVHNVSRSGLQRTDSSALVSFSVSQRYGFVERVVTLEK